MAHAMPVQCIRSTMAVHDAEPVAGMSAARYRSAREGDGRDGADGRDKRGDLDRCSHFRTPSGPLPNGIFKGERAFSSVPCKR
jgi:hypothetical protein